ncbi:MAG: RNA methyltransferase [Dehalococcoidales bacterium]|nr:RNA methyltransferase [Dehalococcoidales bacterium]
MTTPFRDSPPLKPLKWYKDLAEKEARREAGAFMVEGERAVRQIITAHPEAVQEIVITDEPPPLFARYTLRQVNESQFKSISAAKTPQGIAAVVKLPAETYANELPAVIGERVLLLEVIQDPGNCGTLIRTAAAFGFAGVILSEKCADPFSPKVVQSAAGSILSLWLRRTPDYLALVAALKKQEYAVIAADLRGEEDPAAMRKSGKILLALGNEAAGLSPELLKMADCRLKIPVNATAAESLNVAVCGGIFMYLATRQG